MANIKISDLTAASTAADANEFEINEAGTSKKVTGSQIKAFVNADDGALASLDTVDTAQIDDGAITTAKLNADAVDGTKIADDAIDSEHYAAGSIDAEHIADSAVTAPKVAGTNGTSGQVLQSDGDGTMSFVTLAAAGGFSNMDVFTSPGTWTNPGNVEKVKVTVVAGGGGWAGHPGNWPINYSGQTGGTSSFGAYCSATGGTGGRIITPPQASTSTSNGYGGLGSGGQLNMRGGAAIMGPAEMQANYPTGAKGGGNAIGGSSYLSGGGFAARQVNSPVQGTYGSGAAGIIHGPSARVAGGGGGGTAIEVIPMPTATNVPVTVGNGGGNVGTGNAPYRANSAAGVVIVEY